MKYLSFIQILAAPGAEDFGALLYDSDPRYAGKDLDEATYVHAIQSAVGVCMVL